MAMRKSTKNKIMEMIKVFGNKEFTSYDNNVTVSLGTLHKYDLVENHKEVTEYSLENLVDFLNKIEGEECYYDGTFAYGKWSINNNGNVIYTWTDERICHFKPNALEILLKVEII